MKANLELGKVRILLIEDDVAIAKSIELALAAEGIVLDLTILGEDGLEFSKMYRYDLIILDLMLPDVNGYEILKQIRQLRIDAPILILSGLCGIEEKIKGLGCGADDYLTKPFHSQELLARIKAIIRRAKGHSAAVFKIGNLSVDCNLHLTHIDGKLIRLTAKEQILIEALAMRKGNVVSKESLLGQLYNPVDEPGLKIIDVFICKMRKKLFNSSGGMNYIETVWGRGYALKEGDEMEVEDSVRLVAND
jgi:two-component system cell cycle response regulator CtrA